jgi:hypothetical protein
MKVKVTTERECCEGPDLRPVEGTRTFGRHPEFVFCIHCGRHLEYETFTDAAGGRDWRYRRLALPGEQV